MLSDVTSSRGPRKSRQARRVRGRRHRDWQIQVHLGPRPGPYVAVASPEEVLTALERVDPEMPWPEARPLVVPLFDRVRPFPLGLPEPVRTLLPPGLSVSFGIDVGPAHIKVSQEMLARWGITLGDLSTAALANVAQIADGLDPGRVRTLPFDGVTVAALQTGTGTASTFVLLPDAIGRLFGQQPRAFLAPCRDVLLGLPAGVDLGLAVDLYVGLAEQDPNCLSPILFRFDGRSMSYEPLGLALFANV
jgi:hypothetical protein